MTFSGRQCAATSRKTGRRCGQPAVEGDDFCRMHAEAQADAVDAEGVEDQRAPEQEVERPPKVGAPELNINALRHGAYSARLLPEEQDFYNEKVRTFSAALGPMDTFDRELVHLLSIISVRLDQAVMRGAEHAAYAGMVKQILDLLRELRATRASRDAAAESSCVTFGDLFAALNQHFAARGVAPGGPAPTAQPSGTLARHCDRCGFEMAHEVQSDGRMTCTNCGASVQGGATPPACDARSNTQSDSAGVPVEPSANSHEPQGSQA